MKYLSKFLSLFLVGAMLYATGCTDYDQDIKDLNNKVDALEEELVKGKIDPLAADLDALKGALEKAIEEGNAKIAENKEAIDALKAMDKEHDAAIKDAEDAIAAAVVELEALKGQLAELEGKHDADIEAVRAELKEQIDAVNATIAEAVARIAENEEAIEALKAKDAELAKAIEDAEAAIAANAADIEVNADAIAANADAIETLQTDLLGLTDKFNAYTIATDAAIKTLEGRVDAAEAAIETLEGNVEELYTLHDNQNLLIENLDGRLEELAQYTQDQLDLLAEADLALKTLIEALDTKVTNLENSFIDYQKIVNEQFEKAYADIAKNTELINALTAKHNEEVAALQAQDAAILQTLDRHAAWLVELEESLAALDQRVGTAEALIAKIQTNIAQMQVTIDSLTEDLAELETTVADFQKQMGEQIARLDGAIDAALAQALEAAKDAEDAAKAYTDELQKALESELANIRTTLDQLSAYATTIEQKIDEYIASNDKVIEGLKGDIAEILNRVQSIVFVPEYTDGKGTINWAKAGDTLVESRSTLVYQVYPAYCAAAIANTPAVGDVVAPLSFDMTDALKTRGGNEAPQMNIVGVAGDAEGRLYVTFEARNFGEKFYAGEVEYAASLVLTTENENLASCYTNLVAAKSDKAEQISMDIMYGDEVITNKCYNLTENGAAYEFEYTDTERVEKVLPEHFVRFTVGEKTYDGIDALNGAGYALEMERADYIKRIFNDTLGTSPFKVEEVDGILQVSVEEVNGKLIYQPLYVGYTYTAGTLKAEAYSNFATVPVQADVEFNGVETYWLYSTDAAVDAAGTGAYTRVLDLTIAESTLPSDVKALDVLAMTPNSLKVTLDGKDAAVDAKIVVNGEKMFLEFANFEWGKTYEVEAEYDVADQYGQVSVEVTVKATVTTVDRNRDEIIIVNLEPSTAMFEPNLVMTERYGDTMESAFTQLVFGYEKHYDIDADKWCKDNFSLGQYTALDALKADGKDVSADNTMLLIDETTGWEVSVAFDYTDFDFVPAQIEYTKTITTWYGQEVIVNKVLNFEFPVYDFKHNSKYVYGADMDFYSQVQPEYTWKNDNEAEGLLKFDVAAVELRAAFSVVDAQGNKLSETDMNNLSLSYNFEIEDAEHTGIDIDPATHELSYYGSNPFVNVRGNLVITNDNGATYVVPTSFDEGGKYASYNVVKFNPIGTAQVIKNPTIDVNNSIAYNVHILDYVKLEDYRTGGRQSYPLITDGAWVVGNGENGFAQGVDVRDTFMYRINEVWVDDTSDVDDEIRPYIYLNNGTLTFDNTQQLELTAPFTIPVTLKFQNCWMEMPQQVTVKVTFNPIK